jgi:tagatose-6-phosphate ketose/aldose isomerase
MSQPSSRQDQQSIHAGSWTAREIAQQPDVWRATRDLVHGLERVARDFLTPLLARRDLRIILTGAGSSAYIGQCLQPALLACLACRVEAIATTDLVAGPTQYFQRDVPTLLVSFARSGGSPESLAAVDLAEQHVTDCYHLAITCNAAGDLSRRLSGLERGLVIVLPEATHDRGFAMTSSFSSMLYAAYLMLAPEAFSAQAHARILTAGDAVIRNAPDGIRALAARRHARTVYLGSCGLSGIASEAALKLLELTDGAVAAVANTPLGFRHGPKTFVTPDTLVVVFASGDTLTRRYDMDLARELRADGIAARVIVLSAPGADLADLDAIVIPAAEGATDTELAFPYVVWAQLYALAMSIEFGRTPDTPSASGTVSRVVQGVTIYPSRRP